ncbi:unnamed protein product [Cylicocyclus nassatus]|uniref:Methyltransferase domain-containing protein n=1 Tax=Cylicocyclus nassatus TaxID=53992 RepID=A0AA36MD08_CYLNA|nr:unnamed protein product [Cylicocyclus nassatus]
MARNNHFERLLRALATKTRLIIARFDYMGRFRYRRNHTLLITAAVTILLLYKFFIQEKTETNENIVLEINYVEKRLIGKISAEPIPHRSKPSARMIEFYKAQVPQRRAYLEATYKYQPETYTYIYNNLAPEVFCPELIRVGTTHDGGKWICSPFRIPDGCTIISLGLYNEITFERELQHIIDKRCNIFAYDSNDQEVSTIVLLDSIRTKASKATIAAESNPSKNEYTLAELLQGEKVKDIEILKCDIEGSELTVLPDFLEQHKPAQVS